MKNVAKVQCYLYASEALGFTVFTSGNIAKNYPDDYVLLAEKEVEFDIPLSAQEITNQRIDNLRGKIEKIRAEAQQQIAKVEREIQTLLAIGHD